MSLNVSVGHSVVLYFFEVVALIVAKIVTICCNNEVQIETLARLCSPSIKR